MGNYHKFDEGSYAEWDGIAKTITEALLRSSGWEIVVEPEVYCHDVKAIKDLRAVSCESEMRATELFDRVYRGLYDTAHVPVRRYKYSRSDADWILSFPMALIDGDRRYYRVRATNARAAYEAGHIKQIKCSNMRTPDDFIVVKRSHYEMCEIPIETWEEWRNGLPDRTM